MTGRAASFKAVASESNSDGPALLRFAECQLERFGILTEVDGLIDRPQDFLNLHLHPENLMESAFKLKVAKAVVLSVSRCQEILDKSKSNEQCCSSFQLTVVSSIIICPPKKEIDYAARRNKTTWKDRSAEKGKR